MPFTRQMLANLPLETIHEGSEKERWANARVYLFAQDGLRWTVKDFFPCGKWVRNTTGRFMTSREIHALQRLDGIEGVPRKAFRLDDYALCYLYQDGVSMGTRNISALTGRLTRDFFLKLEQVVHGIHARGIVHLDLRNGGNVLVSPENKPVLLDFQSSLDLEKTPRVFHRLLKHTDLSGVYKHWMKFDPESMDEDRKRFLMHMNKKRRLWPFQGYWIRKRHHDLVVAFQSWRKGK